MVDNQAAVLGGTLANTYKVVSPELRALMDTARAMDPSILQMWDKPTSITYCQGNYNLTSWPSFAVPYDSGFNHSTNRILPSWIKLSGVIIVKGNLTIRHANLDLRDGAPIVICQGNITVKDIVLYGSNSPDINQNMYGNKNIDVYHAIKTNGNNNFYICV